MLFRFNFCSFLFATVDIVYFVWVINNSGVELLYVAFVLLVTYLQCRFIHSINHQINFLSCCRSLYHDSRCKSYFLFFFLFIFNINFNNNNITTIKTSAHVYDVMRATLPTLELDAAFEAKEELASSVKNALSESFTS
jgi:hypothetical protein